MSWSRLSIEVRLMILRDVAELHPKVALSPLAIVSKEWNPIVESIIFRRISLNRGRTRMLNTIVTPERRAYVRHIWLHILLDELDRGQNNDAVFTMALTSLTQALSEWSSEDSPAHPGITLEFSAHAPSEWKNHAFGHASGIIRYPHVYDEKCSVDEYGYAFDRWVSTRSPLDQARIQELQRKVRAFEMEALSVSSSRGDFAPLHLRSLEMPSGIHSQLQHCPVVTNFLMRRQHGHQIDKRDLFYILGTMPCLEKISVEFWSGSSGVPSSVYIKSLMRYLSDNKSVKSLSVFENSRHVVSGFLMKREQRMWTAMAFVFAMATRRLENLAVSYAADGKIILENIIRGYQGTSWRPTGPDRRNLRQLLSTQRSELFPYLDREGQNQELRVIMKQFCKSMYGQAPDSLTVQPSWTNLKKLALTCELFVATSDNEDIDSLLVLAGKAALRMPNLEIMEFWHDDEDGLFIFTYIREDERKLPTLTVTSTWKYTMNDRVVRTWQRVANKFLREKVIEVTMDVLLQPAYAFNGVGIELLELRDLVIHSVSRTEFEWNSFWL